MCSQFPQIAVVSATVDLFTIWSVSDTAEGVHEPAGCASVAALPHRICEKVDMMVLCTSHHSLPIILGLQIFVENIFWSSGHRCDYR